MFCFPYLVGVFLHTSRQCTKLYAYMYLCSLLKTNFGFLVYSVALTYQIICACRDEQILNEKKVAYLLRLIMECVTM